MTLEVDAGGRLAGSLSDIGEGHTARPLVDALDGDGTRSDRNGTTRGGSGAPERILVGKIRPKEPLSCFAASAPLGKGDRVPPIGKNTSVDLHIHW